MREVVSDYMNGVETTILLDFNCDGNILNAEILDERRLAS
jgi:hypothetical protein